MPRLRAPPEASGANAKRPGLLRDRGADLLQRQRRIHSPEA
ncbi:hypothetical protein [Rubricoccus marinus]|nr:hypothetical protein [Rubricoccus marinus]